MLLNDYRKVYKYLLLNSCMYSDLKQQIEAINESFDGNCSMCTGFIGEGKDETNIIHESPLMVAAINPRFSPHLGRCAVIPKRHLGLDGRYGVSKLGPDESKEYNLLLMATIDAIYASFSHLGMKYREGLPLIDYLVRPSVHPSGDLFPTYEGPVEFMGYKFPQYDGINMIANDIKYTS